MDGNSSTVKIEIRVDDKGSLVIRQLQGNIAKAGRDAEKSFEGLGRQGEMVNTVLRKMVGYFAALKLVDFARDTVMLAARYETLGVTMARAGKNAGYLPSQMAAFERQLESQGIAMIEAREVLTRMAAAYMDLSQAAQLARAAQDVAVAGGVNSSQAFESMVRAIQSGETEILRTLGLNVTFEDSYKRLAQQLHKNKDALTEQERMQARVNVVLQAAQGYSGLYEIAMEKAGKQITSFTRYWADMQTELGQSQLPAVTELVQAATDRIKEFTKYVKDPETQERLAGIGKTAVNTFDTLTEIGKTAGGLFMTVLDGWNSLPEIIQEIGIIGALLGGGWGKAALVGLTVAASGLKEINNVAQAQRNISAGTASVQDRLTAAKYELSRLQSVTEADVSPQIAALEAKVRDLTEQKSGGYKDSWQLSPSVADKYTFREPLKSGAKANQPLDDATTRKILDARKDLENARLEFLQTAAEVSGEEVNAKLLGLSREYENAVASVRKEMVGAGPEETSALQGVIDYETKKYEIKRQFLEKSLTAEREEQRAEAQLKLAQLQGVDTYDAEIAAIHAKYAKARVTPGSVEGQLADQMETAEIAAKERDRLKTAIQLRGEYAQMTSNSKAYYAAQVQLLEIEQALAKTAEERQVITERLAEATAHRDGDWLDAANRSLRDYGDTATDVFTQTQLVASSTMSNIEDGLTLMATKGKITVTDMLRSIQADFSRMFIRTNITGPFSRWAGNGGLSDLFAGILHEGGSAGDPRNLRLVDSRMFLNAPRYHTGKTGEVPTILKDNEWVFTPQQVAALGRSQGAAPAAQAPVVNIYVQSESGTSARVADQRMDFDGDRWVVGVFIRSYMNNTGGLQDFLNSGGGRA